jgi:hypothetical protein
MKMHKEVKAVYSKWRTPLGDIEVLPYCPKQHYAIKELLF